MTDHAVEGADRRVLRRQMLADDVYEAIKTMLMDHVVRPGARISIDGLAREFQVSSTPVREALARLESEGLALKEPLKGYRATQLLTLAEFDDLYRFRLLLEPWAARRAAELITDEGRDRLRAELATAVEPTSVDYAGYKSLTVHDNRFHTLIATLSGSEQVRLAFQRTHCHLHIFRLHYERDIGPEVLTEHRTLVDAITSGNPPAAEAAMTRHIQNSMQSRLRKIYE
ncbi:GntR family transcriptional regulator [Kribbella yunnanensis]|uniref:GntR family transcriptional regulator n=1 Tax=Kribbella yunnanensis TaxID=190194 RepID=A0ABP4SYY3_9ACTN